MSLLALLATGGVAIPTPSIDACANQICQAGGDPGCDTLSNCNDTGEQHRVGWNHTDCNDTYHHIAVHKSLNGGSYSEVSDNVSCDAADPDADCCDWIKASYEGYFMTQKSVSSDLGSCTRTHQYRIRVETDGTDTAIDTCTASGAATGCNTTCFA